MPIYEYLCSKCQCKFELLRAMSHSEDKAQCPGCGSEAERAPSRFTSKSEGLPDFVGSSVGASSGGGGCGSCSSTNCGSCGL